MTTTVQVEEHVERLEHSFLFRFTKRPHPSRTQLVFHHRQYWNEVIPAFNFISEAVHHLDSAIVGAIARSTFVRAGLATYSEKAPLVVVQLLHLKHKLPLCCDVDVYENHIRKLVMRQLVATLHHMIHLLPTSFPQRLHLPCHQRPHCRPVNVPYFLELLGHHLLVVEVAGEQSELVTAFPGYVNMTVCV